MRDQTPQADGVHVDAVDLRAARAARVGRRGVRRGGQTGRGPGRRDHLGGPGGRAARRVDLVRVVQLDDLDRLVVARGLLGEAQQQQRADGEVRGDENAGVRPVGQRGLHLVQPVAGPAGRADHDVDARFDGVQDVSEGGVGHGEVHRHLRSGEVAEVVADVVPAGEDEVGRGLHGAADLAAHPSGRTDDGDREGVALLTHPASLGPRPPHSSNAVFRSENGTGKRHWASKAAVGEHGQRGKVRSSSKGPTTARDRGRPASSTASSCTASAVTSPIWVRASSSPTYSP